MDVKAIVKNFVKKGPAETLRIYKERENDRKRKQECEALRKELVAKIIATSFPEQKNLFIEYLNKRYGESVSDKIYEKELKSIFIKEVYPAVYNSEALKPVENKVVFMERGGAISPSLSYMSKYIKKHTDYEVKKHVLMIRSVPNEEHYEYTREYIKDAATAKAIFICTANDYMAYFNLRPETTYIQLWHGCGAFKKVGLSTIDKKFGKSAASHKEYPLNTNYSYVTIASPELSWVFEESMGIEKDSGIIVPTGISRTDEFFDKEFIDKSYEKLYAAIPQAKGKKVILYAPTFRGEVATCVSPDKLDVEKFAKALGDEYILICKHHPSVKKLPEIPEEYDGTFAFDMTRGKGMNINELMTVSDICITDYSSVAFEYSLFERPMIFFTYDIEEYIDDRGLYYEFDEITPGPMFKENEEMIDYILNIEERFDKQEVIDFKNKFMCCCDGNSSERILKLIK